MHASAERDMIRPFTCVCFLWLAARAVRYQAKHRVQTIDREIEKVVSPRPVRERTRVLR
jgi:hypothetical protein